MILPDIIPISVKTTYQFKVCHCKHKYVSWPSYLNDVNQYTWKDSLYIVTGSSFLSYLNNVNQYTWEDSLYIVTRSSFLSYLNIVNQYTWKDSLYIVPESQLSVIIPLPSQTFTTSIDHCTQNVGVRRLLQWQWFSTTQSLGCWLESK